MFLSRRGNRFIIVSFLSANRFIWGGREEGFEPPIPMQRHQVWRLIKSADTESKSTKKKYIPVWG